MGFLSFLDPVMDVLLGWTLYLPPFWGIILISFLIALLITLCYKWFTDQDLMKRLKEELKAFQKEMKELKDHPDKAMEVQKKAMETNMKYMGQSLKPTLVTFIPIILIFGWLNAHYAFEALHSNEEFTTALHLKEGVVDGIVKLQVPDGLTLLNDVEQKFAAGKAEWALKGILGEYVLQYSFDNKSFSKKIIITEDKKYEEPVLAVDDEKVKSIEVGNKKLIVLNLFGWKLGWLGSYIILSIIFSMSLRKLMKLY
ncbi:DUF106 domain-containing protein [Candidatus Woesearchaeota archaeon]|nr:DUF106 domain-containing protein [Candidatus Woesearchaeota archaeon]